MKDIIIFGGIIIDRYLMIDKFPKRSQDAYILESFDKAGGSSFNIAMKIKALGGNPYVVSAIGNDEFGNKIIRYMQDQQLPINCMNQTKGETGYCLVLVEPDGERAFLTAKGCESSYLEDLIPEKVEKSCSTAVVSGYYLIDETADLIIKKLKSMKFSGYKIIFDPSPHVDKINKKILNELAEICDVIISNITEAEYLTRNLEFSKARNNIKIWAQELNKIGIDIIIKKGPEGGELFKDGVRIPYKAINSDFIDTKSAGDSFTAEIAYSIANNTYYSGL